jgi:hypothetical protein
MGRLKQSFNKITWVNTNVKTLGVHHGYNIDNEASHNLDIKGTQGKLKMWSL